MRPVAFAWVFLRFPLRQGERTPCERMCRAVTRDGAVMVSTDLQRSVRVCDAAWVTAWGGGASVPGSSARGF